MSKVSVRKRGFGSEPEELPDGTVITFQLQEGNWGKVSVWLEDDSIVIGDGQGLIIIPHVANKIKVQINPRD